MPDLHLLIPDAQVPAEFAPELLRDLALPNLNLLAAHARTTTVAIQSPLLTTSQAWLLGQRDLAALWASACGLPPPKRARWLAQPIHMQLGMEHLVPEDPAHLQLSASDSQALADAALPVLAEAGWHLQVASATHWFLERDDAIDLAAPALDCAIGKNAGLWQPFVPAVGAADTPVMVSAEKSGSGYVRVGERRRNITEDAALAWRRVANEIQMHWYNHAVNTRREEAHLKPVNALWLTGSGQTVGVTALPYTQVRLDPLPGNSGAFGFLHDDQTILQGDTELEIFNRLAGPWRTEDWHAFREGLQVLEQRAGKLVATLRNGKIKTLKLAIGGVDTVIEHDIARADLWKFWRRGEAADLFVEPQ